MQNKGISGLALFLIDLMFKLKIRNKYKNKFLKFISHYVVCVCLVYELPNKLKAPVANIAQNI